MWDIGEEILPHADEWTRVKRECFFGSSSNGRSLEQKAVQDQAISQDQGVSSVSPSVVALENALVLRHGDEDNDHDNRNHDSSNSPNTNNGAASAARREPNKAAPAIKTSTVSATVAASEENARCAIRLLRPEILRQAGVRPAWRTGRVTAVLDRSACSLDHTAAVIGPTPGRGKNTKSDPLIEV